MARERTERLFVVCPGPITSMNDWERHWVGAGALMGLLGLHPRECVVIRDERDLFGQRDIFSRGLEVVHPMVSAYRPYTDEDRARISERVAAVRDGRTPAAKPGEAALAARLLGRTARP